MGRYLGQHFLINKNKLKKIVEALELKSGDTIIEIGPGHGELTKEIIERLKDLKIERFKIIAIEKDKKLVEFLRKKISEDKNIEIIHGDALKILPQIVKLILRTSDVLRLKIVGNIPYYITGRLLRVLSELENKPSLIVLTIQKEVAQRIIAESPRMNLLAASVQFWAKPEIIGYISRKDFRPAPEVDSAIIRFNIRRFDLPKLSPILRRSNLQEIKDKYYRLIRVLFRQPRKTILNNVLEAEKRGFIRIIEADKRGFLSKKLHKIGVSPSDRPQNLTIKQIIKLSSIFLSVVSSQ